MKRRDLLKGLFGLAVCPSLANAKTERVRPVIGYLSSRSPSDSAQIVAAFCKGLAEAGYIEGRDATVEYRWADGDYERLPVLAADLVRLSPAVLIAAGGEPSALAAKAATDSIPIVCSLGGDPVKVGLAKSLNRPGGNVTGISLLATELESKRLGLLHELVPRAEGIGVLVDRNFQESETQTLEVTQAARQIGRSVEIVYASNDGELDVAFERLAASSAEALLVCAAPFFDTRRERIIAFETRQRIPAIYQFRDYAAGGGLMSYGIRPPDSYRQVGAYAGRILGGASPSELPIVRPTTFEFVINLKSAATMGIEVPMNLLARADEVIE
jgi:putative tryptophan/tyrosine transport system substrate-binding protein